MKVNAQDLGRTRLCRAEMCPNDAENYSRLCTPCQRKERRVGHIPTHVMPPRIPDTLRCSACNTWKLDEEFPHKPAGHRNSGGRDAARRGRYCFCNDCNNPTQAQIRAFKTARKNQARRTKSA